MIKLFVSMWRAMFCKIKGHKLIDAGSCPFTGLTYKACTHCGGTVAVDKSKNN